MTPDDIAATRVLLARAKAAGWAHWTTRFNGSAVEHEWRRGTWDAIGHRKCDLVSLYEGSLTVRLLNGPPWLAPLLSGAQVTTVLELAGALPPVVPLCKHCCMTRLLGHDPRLWVCEHCGSMLRHDCRPAPAEWVTEAYPDPTTYPKPLDPHGERCSIYGADARREVSP